MAVDGNALLQGNFSLAVYCRLSLGAWNLYTHTTTSTIDVLSNKVPLSRLFVELGLTSGSKHYARGSDH
jgi:hypothetical protein